MRPSPGRRPPAGRRFAAEAFVERWQGKQRVTWERAAAASGRGSSSSSRARSWSSEKCSTVAIRRRPLRRFPLRRVGPHPAPPAEQEYPHVRAGDPEGVGDLLVAEPRAVAQGEREALPERQPGERLADPLAAFGGDQPVERARGVGQPVRSAPSSSRGSERRFLRASSQHRLAAIRNSQGPRGREASKESNRKRVFIMISPARSSPESPGSVRRQNASTWGWKCS